jgi:hypothetical protein
MKWPSGRMNDTFFSNRTLKKQAKTGLKAPQISKSAEHFLVFFPGISPDLLFSELSDYWCFKFWSLFFSFFYKPEGFEFE